MSPSLQPHNGLRTRRGEARQCNALHCNDLAPVCTHAPRSLQRWPLRCVSCRARTPRRFASCSLRLPSDATRSATARSCVAAQPSACARHLAPAEARSKSKARRVKPPVTTTTRDNMFPAIGRHAQMAVRCSRSITRWAAEEEDQLRSVPHRVARLAKGPLPRRSPTKFSLRVWQHRLSRHRRGISVKASFAVGHRVASSPLVVRGAERSHGSISAWSGLLREAARPRPANSAGRLAQSCGPTIRSSGPAYGRPLTSNVGRHSQPVCAGYAFRSLHSWKRQTWPQSVSPTNSPRSPSTGSRESSASSTVTTSWLSKSRASSLGTSTTTQMTSSSSSRAGSQSECTRAMSILAQVKSSSFPRVLSTALWLTRKLTFFSLSDRELRIQATLQLPQHVASSEPSNE
jgi:hypothetical protein